MPPNDPPKKFADDPEAVRRLEHVLACGPWTLWAMIEDFIALVEAGKDPYTAMAGLIEAYGNADLAEMRALGERFWPPVPDA